MIEKTTEMAMCEKIKKDDEKIVKRIKDKGKYKHSKITKWKTLNEHNQENNVNQIKQ